MTDDFDFKAAGEPKRAKVVAAEPPAVPDPIVWETACGECGKRLAVRANIPVEVNADGTATYNLKCPKCGDRAVHVRPAPPASRKAKPAGLMPPVSNAKRKQSIVLVARIAWGVIAVFACMVFIHYETSIYNCKTVFQEISVSLICMTEISIAFMACYAFTSVLQLLVADPDLPAT